MRKNIFRTNETEFLMVESFLRISPKRIKSARSVLLDGMSCQDVAIKIGCTRQAVSQTVIQIKKMIERYRSAIPEAKIPPGWEEFTIVAPKHLIERFRDEVSGYVKGGI